jgi:hypothetical protein
MKHKPTIKYAINSFWGQKQRMTNSSFKNNINGAKRYNIVKHDILNSL